MSGGADPDKRSWASFSEESLIEMPPAGLEAISYTGHGEKSQTEKAKPPEGSAVGEVCRYERLPSRLAIVLLRTVMPNFLFTTLVQTGSRRVLPLLPNRVSKLLRALGRL